jgi:hypothetical protein
MIHVCSPLHNILIIFIMSIVETILTVAAVDGLVNRLIRVFRSIKKWLKDNDHLYKENKRMMEIWKITVNATRIQVSRMLIKL